MRKTLKPLEHQKAVKFHRGDSALVVLAYDARTMPELAGTPINASPVVTPGTVAVGYGKTLKDAPPVSGMIIAMAALGSAPDERQSPRARTTAVARARRWRAASVFDRHARHDFDLLFYKPYGTFPATVEDVAPHALPTERVRADAKLGVYWESYGTDPNGEKMNVSLDGREGS